MSAFSIAVLLLAALGTAGLLVYIKFWLPRAVEERTLESLRAFGKAIELRFPSHQGLTEQVLQLSMEVATALKLSPHERHLLEFAVHLRDIGLCAIPYSLVNGRSWEDWSAAEQTTYDRHAEISGAMLEMVPSLKQIAEIVRHHHMRHEDFPKLVEGKFFTPPIQSEILNAVAAYVWIENHQGSVAARAAITAKTGTEIDPAVAEALLSVLSFARIEEPLRRAVV